MASEYAKYVVDERAKKTMEDPGKAHRYARDVIKGRWYQAELTIMTDPYWAYCYASEIINGRWPEAESVIMTDPYWAYWYARYVIKGRWPEAEGIISKAHGCWNSYKDFLSTLS